MKYSPLPFGPLMARAWYEDRKTQTRRVMKIQPESIGVLTPTPAGELWYVWPAQTSTGTYIDRFCRCPYGGPGDRVWVRETLVRDAELNAVRYECDSKHINPAGVTEWPWMPNKLAPRYMPRWACRSYGEILAVRAEPVRTISNDDAIAEGIAPVFDGGIWSHNGHVMPRDGFADLWDAINAERGYGWDTNPWVWVLTLKRVEA